MDESGLVQCEQTLDINREWVLQYHRHAYLDGVKKQPLKQFCGKYIR